MEDTDEYDDIEKRLSFIQSVVPHDDVYEFADVLLQMNSVFATALHEFTNLDTVFATYPEAAKAFKNLLEFRLRMRFNDTRMIQLEKFDLSN